MHLDPTRIRRGELLAAIGAFVLVVLLFIAKWYGPGVIASGVRATGTVNGWHGLIHLRWLILVTVVASLAFGVIPAGPQSRWRAVADGAVGLLALATVLWLGYRVLISIPPGETAAAYVGLACAVVILLGAGLALWDATTSTPATPGRSGARGEPPDPTHAEEPPPATAE